tara:strand:+ start:2909 stop:3640 length:732 start_codon:yes stop_codon:yes gene_type:complete
MFELNDKLEVKVAKEIGPNKKSVVLIDNFYKDPDSIRELCFNTETNDDPDLIGSLPGVRICFKTDEVRKNLQSLYNNLCSDRKLWNYRSDQDQLNHCWRETTGFLCNVIDDETLLKNPMGIIPHQDSFNKYPLQFGSLIYLNTPEECAGGTNLYSFCGNMSLDDYPPITGIELADKDASEMSPKESFDHIRWSLNNNKYWKVEHEFEMVYNRMVLYEADVLHGQSVDLGMFTDHKRINQVLFL